MSDEHTEVVASAEDAALVAEFGAENVDIDVPASDPAPAPVDTPDAEKPSEDISDDGVADANADAPEFDEDHDADATLQEDSAEETPAEDADKTSQVDKSAQDLAKKWEAMNDEDRADKVSKLFNNRKSELTALAKELGMSTDDLLEEYTEPDEPAKEAKSPMDDEAAFRQKIVQEVKADLEPAFKHADRQRVVTELTKWGQHNKLSKEDITAISEIDSDVVKSFEKLQFDPETGAKLTFKTRLRLALNGSEDLQSKLVNSKAKKRADGIVAGLQAADLPTSGKGDTTEDIMGIEDPNKFLKAADSQFGARKW